MKGIKGRKGMKGMKGSSDGCKWDGHAWVHPHMYITLHDVMGTFIWAKAATNDRLIIKQTSHFPH